MAGEWIKTRTNLWDDPRVSRICDLTEQPIPMIIGGLYWLWKTADQHTDDGFLNGMSVTAIDRNTGIKGFGAALVDIKWIEPTKTGINIVRFDEHNGASAKARAITAKRVAKHRSHSEDEGDVTGHLDLGNGDTVTVPLAREDKNIDNKKSKPKLKEKTVGEKSATGSRLPDDWRPSPEDQEYCKKMRPELSLAKVATNFYEYWSAKPGKEGRKTRWDLTWRTWVRRESVANAGRVGRSSGPQGPVSSLAQQQDAANAEAKRLLFGTPPKTDDEEGLVFDA
jgi:hypothetical protein